MSNIEDIIQRLCSIRYKNKLKFVKEFENSFRVCLFAL